MPVGLQVMMPDYGDTLTLGDSSVMVRSGSLVQKADAPKLAALRQYQVCGKRRTSAGALPGQLRQIASNGAGVLIAAAGANNTVYRSTDGGDTWVAITNGLGLLHAIGGAAFGAGRFVVCGMTSSGTSALLAYSTDNGLTWATGTQVNAGNFATASHGATGKLAYTGNRFVCVMSTGGGRRGALARAGVDTLTGSLGRVAICRAQLTLAVLGKAQLQLDL
jgi:hypothetical protein